MNPDALYLHHILDASAQIAEYVSVGLRDILAHNYMGVDMDAVW